MKKIIIEVVLIIIFSFLSVYFYINNNYLKNENRKLYNFFSNKEVLDSNGNINISEIKSKRDGLVDDLKKSFSVDEFEIDELSNKLENIKNDNNQMMQEINSLSNEVDSLTKKVNSLSNQYNTLNSKYYQMVRTKQVGTTFLINNFPTINQYPKYPTGCESVALTLLLKYNNVNVGVDSVINNLKKGSMPHMENGVMYGGNPEIEFIGNPYSYAAYGVFEKPMAEVANMYKQQINIKNNFPFDSVLELVRNNRPVMVWSSMNLAIPYISASWIYKPTSERITWKGNEHAVVVIGYNNENVIISDPIGGKIKYQSKSTFISRYNYYGKKALYY